MKYIRKFNSFMRFPQNSKKTPILNLKISSFDKRENILFKSNFRSQSANQQQFIINFVFDQRLNFNQTVQLLVANYSYEK